MKIGNIFFILVLVAETSTGVFSTNHFDGFELKFNKKYADPSEKTKRANIFNKKLKEIVALNLRAELENRDLKFEINKFSDLDSHEFIELYTGFKKSPNRDRAHLDPLAHASKNTKKSSKKPKSRKTKQTTLKASTTTFNMNVSTDSFDWTLQENVVAPVKDQGLCGSCWAFGAVAGVESYLAKKNNNLVLLSEQQVLNCDSPPNYGCNGGDHYLALTYIKNHGLMKASSYKYTGKDGKCKFEKSAVVTKLGSIGQAIDEKEMMTLLVKYGPMPVAMDATILQSYKGGIVRASDCTNYLNHVITLVGYGTLNNVKYWRLKNSWGVDWGEKGFFRLSRGENTCGIAEESYYIKS